MFFFPDTAFSPSPALNIWPRSHTFQKQMNSSAFSVIAKERKREGFWSPSVWILSDPFLLISAHFLNKIVKFIYFWLLLFSFHLSTLFSALLGCASKSCMYDLTPGKAIWNSSAPFHGPLGWKKILSHKAQTFKRNAHKSRQEALKIKSVSQSQIYGLIVNMLQRQRAHPNSSIFCESRLRRLMEERRNGDVCKIASDACVHPEG